MRLKRLEITGFKSFRDRVVLEFGAGVTAIVGPNGCGKSNIVDAIRWVMGEQRVKAMRGKKMDDVIFNGAEGASPVGMAEVVMTLVNDGRPFPGAYAECAEVTVSRRVFRDEESEFSLNKVSCRLLDVREFFLDTGIGARTYSLIEQNSIATLVEAKPEERRQFIEEAAGVAKYKSRKEAALRKMEATQENIVRLADIIREVKSRLQALSRQAKRAEQFKALRQRIREGEIALARQAYGEHTRQKRELEEARDALLGRHGRGEASLQALEAALEAAKIEAAENDRILSAGQEDLYRVKTGISAKEQALAHGKGRAADLQTRREKDAREIEALQRRAAAAESEAETLRRLIAEGEAAVAQLRQETERQEKTVEDLKQSHRTALAGVEEQKVLYVDLVAEKAKHKNTLSSLQKSREDLLRREAKEAAEAEENGRKRALVQETVGRHRSALAGNEEAFAALGGRISEAEGELARLREILEEREDTGGRLKEEKDGKAARLASLREFHEGYAWCGDGPRAVLTAGRTGQRRSLGEDTVLGLVADHLRVPQGYETAVEAALGDRLQYVVVRQQEDGVHAIEYLKSQALGRGSFVPLHLRTSPPEPNAGAHPPGAERLLDALDVQEDFRQVAESLLGDVFLIPSLRQGLHLWRENGFRGTLVTAEGDIISPEGILSGGNGAQGEYHLLQAKREMEALAEDLRGLQARLEEATRERQETQRRIRQWEEEIHRCRTERHRLELQMQSRRKDIQRAEDEARWIDQRLQVLCFNRENLRKEAEQARERALALETELASLAERETSLNDSLRVLQGKAEALRATREEAEQKLTATKVLLASGEEKAEANRRVLARLREGREHVAREIAAREKEIAAGERRLADLCETMEQDKAALATLYAEAEARETALESQRALQQETAGRLREQEGEIRERKKIQDRLGREAQEKDMACRELALQAETLRSAIREKYQIDLEEGAAGAPPLSAPECEALQEALRRDREQSERFGEVNLLALEEFEELNQRHTFLTSQAADLHEALDTLKKTISRINTVSRKRFAETFEGVRQSFQEVYARIFPGGRGELKLTDESDLLETGVDIDIQLPGKRTQNISLLSGGEKSLSAIALIFAILLYRPTPFLVLDEVDAALDDANIALFNRLLREIGDTTQILLVTHNKKTMEVSGALFGVTMQKQGISTLVSVDIR